MRSFYIGHNIGLKVAPITALIYKAFHIYILNKTKACGHFRSFLTICVFDLNAFHIVFYVELNFNGYIA